MVWNPPKFPYALFAIPQTQITSWEWKILYIVHMCFTDVSCCFPMVFPWFSHGFPMFFPWFSIAVPGSSPSRTQAPLLQRQVLAIPVCPKVAIWKNILCIAFPLQQKQSRSQRVAVFQARVLKMAALYDLEMTFQVSAGKTLGRNPVITS